eukprot:3511543-Prymnesium_polylepis.2
MWTVLLRLRALAACLALTVVRAPRVAGVGHARRHVGGDRARLSARALEAAGVSLPLRAGTHCPECPD